MQASKIKPRKTYAIWQKSLDDEPAKLVRFRVNAVITTRTGDSPHDYNSVINGGVYPEDGGEILTGLDPEKILGPYEDYKELIARQEAEMAARVAEAQKVVKQQTLLIKHLYRTIGEDAPNPESRNVPFRKSYGGGLDISYEGVMALIEALKL